MGSNTIAGTPSINHTWIIRSENKKVYQYDTILKSEKFQQMLTKTNTLEI